MLYRDVLPADQGKYGNTECQETDQKTWDGGYKIGQTEEEEEQDHTPSSDRIGRSHFHSPL